MPGGSHILSGSRTFWHERTIRPLRLLHWCTPGHILSDEFRVFIVLIQPHEVIACRLLRKDITLAMRELLLALKRLLCLLLGPQIPNDEQPLEWIGIVASRCLRALLNDHLGYDEFWNCDCHRLCVFLDGATVEQGTCPLSPSLILPALGFLLRVGPDPAVALPLIVRGPVEACKL